MPPVIAVIAAAVTWLGVTSPAWATFIATELLALGASVVLGQVSKLFAKGPSASSLASQLASRTIISRPALAPTRDSRIAG